VVGQTIKLRSHQYFRGPISPVKIVSPKPSHFLLPISGSGSIHSFVGDTRAPASSPPPPPPLLASPVRPRSSAAITPACVSVYRSIISSHRSIPVSQICLPYLTDPATSSPARLRRSRSAWRLLPRLRHGELLPSAPRNFVIRVAVFVRSRGDRLNFCGRR
jgi:hypothetical protein